MAQWGSSKGLISQNISQTMDNQGNPIISSDTTFGASPLGYAARVQALFGLPNATFELTPPDTTLTIDQSNQLPYWDIQEYSAGVMKATATYDSTTNNWGIKLDPGTATTGDYLTMTTRSYLVNDDNLALRQKALAVVAKNGTYAGATQWNMNLTASYYDATDTLLHSGTVATILDNTTWTSMSGTTTTGGTAINAAAHYVDLTYTLTATAPVTSATSVTLKSTLLATSTPAASGGAFLVVNTYYANDTFAVPTGVDYADILCVGAGGGGGGGAVGAIGNVSTTASYTTGGAGGGGGGFLWSPNTYIGGSASYTISVGAAGAGGAGTNFTKASGTVNNVGTALSGQAGAAGGNSSFGTLVVSTGGGGGAGGIGTVSATAPSATRGSRGTANFSAYPTTAITSGRGGIGGTAASGVMGETSTLQSTGWTRIPFTATYPTVGSAGSATSQTGTAFTSSSAAGTTVGGAGGIAGYFGGGGGAGGASWFTNASGTSMAAIDGGSAFSAGGGGGGALVYLIVSGSGGGTATGGAGGAAAGTSASGGGGGGAIQVRRNGDINQAVNITSGTGGGGGQGFVIVAYVA